MAETTTTVEKDPAEYDRLVREKNAAQAQLTACEKRIEELENKIARLKTKHEAMLLLKDSYDTNRKSTRKLRKKDHVWKGDNYNSFQDQLEIIKGMDDTYYDTTLDKQVHDVILQKLGELELQLGQEGNLWDKIKGNLNYWWRQIQSWTN